MPLVRSEVRNEYGLGDPELYRKVSRKEEPKAILDGVAVAGLVGILRQLGDLAEFAADVFHELHEQITATSARGRKMMTRIRNIESALPYVEKAFKEQTSHIHFAYIAGSDWHARMPDEQSFLQSTELPRFMMDSYEECHDPPRLFLLDRFDHSGTGACLKRYSDPSYFRRVWAASQIDKAEDVRKDKTLEKFKRKGSRLKNAENQHTVYMAHQNSRKPDNRERLASPSISAHSISPEHMSTSELRLNQEFSSRSTSFGSKTRESYMEQTSSVNPPMLPGELEYTEMHNPNLHSKDSDLNTSVLHDEPSTDDLDDLSQHDSIQVEGATRSSSVTWDEKAEIVRPTSPVSFDDIPVDKVQVAEDGQDSEPQQAPSEPENTGHSKDEPLVQEDILSHNIRIPGSLSGVNHFDEVTSETDNYVDAPNTLDSETETEVDCNTKKEVQSLSNLSSNGMESKIATNQVTEVQSSTSPDVDVEASNSSCNSLNATRNFNYSSSDGSDHVQSPYVTEFMQNQECSVANDASESKAPNVSEMKDHCEFMQNQECSVANDASESKAPNVSEMKDHCEFMQNQECSVANDASESKAPNVSDMKDHCECIDSGLSSKSRTSQLPTVMMTDPVVESSVLNHSLPTDVSGAPSIQLWTNGGLFGVKPSKPPDLGALSKQNDISSASDFSSHAMKPQLLINQLDAKSDATTNFRSQVKVDSSNTNLSSIVKSNIIGGQNAKISPSCCDNHHEDDSVKQDSHATIQPFSKSDGDDTSSNKFEMTKNSVVCVPLRENYSNGSIVDGPNQTTAGLSSSFSELAQRFLANTIQRKASFSTTSGNVGSETRTYLNNNKEAPDGFASQSSYEPSVNEKVAHVSEEEPASLTSHYPEQSSPPLEYMKISYHPMNGLENSKLKLEFSSGSLCENSEDFTFPSFQLLQGSANTLQEIYSESDDDTFCRSCPYSSEDLSPRSYSNSEQWEQEEKREYFGRESYDDLQRLSSTTSDSRCIGLKQKNSSNMHIPGGPGNFDVSVDKSKVPFRLGSTMELPGLDSVLSFRNQTCSSLPEDPVNIEAKLKDETPSGPPLPPLPPTQWRASKPSVTSEDNDADSANNLNHLHGFEAIRYPPLQKIELHSPSHPSIVGAVPSHPDEKQDQQKMNGQKRLTHSVSNKEVDTREDLLLQIRNKAFNLRRTATSIPRDVPRPTTNATNGNVSAILQKATAIRQAFVSSDDDNWSDA